MTGYDAPLYVLPFDHRGSFAKGLLGIDSNAADAAQTKKIASYKEIIFEGFQKAVDDGVPRDRAAVLVDEQFGETVARQAHEGGYALAMPVEKSGQDEFDFEYGEAFGDHV